MAAKAGLFQGMRLRAKKRPKLSFPQEMAARAVQNQRYVNSFPYWSMVRFNFVRSGAGPYVFTMSSSEVIAFSYGVGDSAPSAAGFGSSSLTMSLAETNLQTKHETIAGEELHISGIGIQPAAGSDAVLAGMVWRNTCAILSLNGGSNRLPMGPLSLLPGGGGLTGSGPDTLGTQALGGGRPQFSHVTNGFPNRNNVMPLPEGFVWRNKSRRDGQLAVILQPAPGRTLTIATPADEVAAAGVRGYNYPGSAFVDVMVWAGGQSTGARSHLQ